MIARDRVLQPELSGHAAVKIVGLGGIGSVLARYGALFLASLDREWRLVLIDGDDFQPSNSARMFFGDHGNKAAAIRDDLLPRLAESSLAILAVEEFVTPDNLGRLVREGDIVLLAVDNNATRKLVNDHCAGLDDICLISGGNDGIGPDSGGTTRRGTYGSVQILLRRHGTSVTPDLARHHPEIRDPADRHPADLSCTELAASVPQILFANVAVASAMLNTLWLHLCGALHYGELALDVADGLMRPVLPLLE